MAQPKRLGKSTNKTNRVLPRSDIGVRKKPVEQHRQYWPGKEDGVPMPENFTYIGPTPETTIHKKICGAKRRPNSPAGPGVCCQPAGYRTGHLGYGACWKHGGNLPSHWTKAARERATELAAQYAEEWMTIYGDPIEISPQEAIVQELNRTAGHVEWLRRELAEGEKSDLYQISERTGRNPDVWVALYQEERKHLLRVAKEAVAMGIEERRVALEEEKGKLIAMVLQAFITDPELALTPEQRVRTPELMRRHLLALGQFSEQQEKTPTVIEAEATLNEAQAMDEVPVDEDAWGTPDDDDEEWDDL